MISLLEKLLAEDKMDMFKPNSFEEWLKNLGGNQNSDGTWDINRSIDFSTIGMSSDTIPVVLNVVKGNYNAGSPKSLKGFPKKIIGRISNLSRYLKKDQVLDALSRSTLSGVIKKEDGTYSYGGNLIDSPIGEKFPILSNRYPGLILVADKIDRIPLNAPSFTNVVITLQEKGVQWVEFLKLKLLYPEVGIKSGIHAAGFYKDKCVIFETKISNVPTLPGYLAWVGPKEDVKDAKGFVYASSNLALPDMQHKLGFGLKFGISFETSWGNKKREYFYGENEEEAKKELFNQYIGAKVIKIDKINADKEKKKYTEEELVKRKADSEKRKATYEENRGTKSRKEVLAYIKSEDTNFKMEEDNEKIVFKYINHNNLKAKSIYRKTANGRLHFSSSGGDDE